MATDQSDPEVGPLGPAKYDAWLREGAEARVTADSAADSHETDRDRRCQNCGAHVSTEWARVNGDNDGRVHACIECATNRDIKRGAAADAFEESKP